MTEKELDLEEVKIIKELRLLKEQKFFGYIQINLWAGKVQPDINIHQTKRILDKE